MMSVVAPICAWATAGRKARRKAAPVRAAIERTVLSISKEHQGSGVGRRLGRQPTDRVKVAFPLIRGPASNCGYTAASTGACQDGSLVCHGDISGAISCQHGKLGAA